MFANLSKIPIKLGILLVGFGLLVVGCDSAGPNANQDQNKDEKIAFETTDWSDNRVTDFGGNSSADAKAAAQKSVPGFTLVKQVAPPPSISGAAASHLAMSDPSGNPRKLYVGYKTVGSGYGGGIEILDADGSFTDPGASSDGDDLQESSVDVQELAVKETAGGNPNFLYVATAVDPDVTIPQSPQFHSINLTNATGFSPSTVEYDVFDLDTGGEEVAVAKSVTLLENSNSDVLVASDSSVAYEVTTGSDYEINNTERATNSSLREIRNVTVTTASNGSGAYALTYEGKIWEWNSGGNGSWGNQQTSGSLLDNPPLSNPNSSSANDNDGIARLTAHDFAGSGYSNFNNAELVFAALNDEGFQVFSPNTDDVRFDSEDLANNNAEVPEIYAASVAVTDHFVYVASGTTIAVYKVQSSGLQNTTDDDGLEYVGQASFEDRLTGSPPFAPINDIHVVSQGNSNGDGNILYVAKSEDGVLKITQDGDALYN